LVPLTQFGLGYLSARAPSPAPWLAGTPLAYFLIAGMGAFCATRGLSPVQARRRGSVIGVSVGAGGALVAILIVVGFVAWLVSNPPHPQSSVSAPPHSMPALVITGIATWSPAIPLIVLVIFFMPFFLATNVFGVGLATLGGVLGGALRGRVMQQGPPELWQPGASEQAGRRGVNLALVVVVVTLLAVVLTLGGLFLTAGAFSAGQAR
jgi:hypothetical protein